MILTGRAALIAALVLPTALAAQARGLPVVNSGFASGSGVAADIGFGNDAAGSGTTFGVTASTVMSIVGISASVSRGSGGVDTDAVWSQAVAVSLRLFGGPLIPFRVTLQGGVGRWGQGIVETVHVPVSLGLAAVIPNPAFAIRPWLAPRLDYQTTTFENSSVSRTEPGVSGGIELGFLNGLTIRSAYDRLFSDDKPGIFSLGAGFTLGR
jgi:hypothetical protein